MPNYAPRVSLSYADMSGVVQEWSQACKAMVVYQHEPDKEVNRVHLHMVMLDCKFKTAEALKRQFLSRVKTERKGNELWSWEHKQFPNPDIKFITYMSEGKLAPVFVKNISPDTIEELRLQWVVYESTPKGESLSEKKEATKTKYELVQDMIKEINNEDVIGLGERQLADYVVRVVLRVLRKNRIVIGRYKIREYRDAVMYYREGADHSFLNFVNQDYKDMY